MTRRKRREHNDFNDGQSTSGDSRQSGSAVQERRRGSLGRARRASAARVDVSIDESQSRPGTGTITIHDNGLGISDFQALLGLGGSGWEGETQIKEDPAGMGFFALCRSEVQVHSGNHRVHLSPDVFLGKDAAEIIEMAETIQGTRICFTGDSCKVALISSLQPDWLRDPPA
jgi:hypothetical protein